MPRLSLVIPVLNESANIPDLSEAIRISLKDISYELIWVDDGSSDNSRSVISASADENTRLIALKGNFGQSAAMQAGMDLSTGSYIGFLDGDGQNHPADIPLLLQLLQDGSYDMAMGFRRKRHDSWFRKKLPSGIANRLIRLLTGVKTKDYGCTLKVIRREFASKLRLSSGMHRFIPVLVHRLGGKIVQAPVQHFPRKAGKSKYGWERTTKVIRDLYLLLRKQRTPVAGPLYEIDFVEDFSRLPKHHLAG